MNIAAKIQIRSIFTLANNSTRVSNLFGRKADNIYGVEEGHGFKNEVRKEKWIKRHRVHKNVIYFFLMYSRKFNFDVFMDLYNQSQRVLYVHLLLVFYS